VYAASLLCSVTPPRIRAIRRLPAKSNRNFYFLSLVSLCSFPAKNPCHQSPVESPFSSRSPTAGCVILASTALHRGIFKRDFSLSLSLSLSLSCPSPIVSSYHLKRKFPNSPLANHHVVSSIHRVQRGRLMADIVETSESHICGAIRRIVSELQRFRDCSRRAPSDRATD